jgi:hypothetical protein
MNFELILRENKRNFFERELTHVSSECGISSPPIFDDLLLNFMRALSLRTPSFK